MKSTSEQGCSDAGANTWTALNLIHCFPFITSKYMSPCLVHKCLLRTLRENEGREGRGGGVSDRSEGCHRQRDVVRGMAAEAEGDAERGGRWRRMRSGAPGKGRRMDDRRH